MFGEGSPGCAVAQLLAANSSGFVQLRTARLYRAQLAGRSPSEGWPKIFVENGQGVP
jgi:hypothetical protein